MFHRISRQGTSSRSRPPRTLGMASPSLGGTSSVQDSDAASSLALTRPEQSTKVTLSPEQSNSKSRATSQSGSLTEPQPNTYRPTRSPGIRKILALDGGGVRGVSSIIILTYIMDILRKKRGGQTVQPWQEFDIIGGTSTGGLLALMLGRMRMTLRECAEAYVNLTRDVFQALRRHPADPRRLADFLNAKGKFDESVLQDAIVYALNRKGLTEETLLQDTRPDSCCVFVCATSASFGSTLFRSYDTDERPNPYYDDCRIWEAARATSAASTFFKPIEIGRYRAKFADGAFGHNNPISDASSEATDRWGPDVTYMAISIGTGDDTGGSLLGGLRNLVDCLARIATGTEESNRTFQRTNRPMVDSGRFYRFNVPGLGDVGLEEHEALGVIESRTQNYLDGPEVSQQVRRCVEKMVSGGQRLGISLEESKPTATIPIRAQNCTRFQCYLCKQYLQWSGEGRWCDLCNIHICSACYQTQQGQVVALHDHDLHHIRYERPKRRESRGCRQCSRYYDLGFHGYTCTTCGKYRVCEGCSVGGVSSTNHPCKGILDWAYS